MGDKYEKVLGMSSLQSLCFKNKDSVMKTQTCTSVKNQCFRRTYDLYRQVWSMEAVGSSKADLSLSFAACWQKDKRTKLVTPAVTTKALDGSFSPVFIPSLTDMTREKCSAKILND